MSLVHGTSITDQAKAGNVGEEHRLRFSVEPRNTSVSMARAASSARIFSNPTTVRDGDGFRRLNRAGNRTPEFPEVGDFEGRVAPLSAELQELDFRTDFYAMQSFRSGECQIVFA
ncbi:hypothetical protein [Rhizobium lentis]|uniref:Sucrose-6-phosphate hydrolase SacC (GH32 family) n=1 Tax=Rhizobium lentis TaxID=1138194 RepID=A0A7W8XL24_9HYPH|nr:hypothetical protein [Rhizobium lentis]MBB4577561.1 sucrose-6-phosphate hydrolase SacC (GH32 family) [Rhizobium lentis]MBB5554132.1 sucrose-6-phosphate hydrolase SacC (GH32 family) [Rhizobium lentis]MBB5564745.1 sucrose-6-phosphate hydrolase SacC (GH32 family) [Rhizobium lentis]MBB5571238.1 sucrose-6-phosphate hydrolase SacC (GH32 family) [Rhizobium lentis]